jgi:hypothetical protein
MSMESSGSGQQSDSEMGCARLAVFFCVSRMSAPRRKQTFKLRDYWK